MKPIPRHEIVTRVTRALGHPIRVSFLESLAMTGTASAKSFSQLSDFTLSDVAYHVRILHLECEVLELVRTQPARGAIEKFFRMAPVPLGTSDWSRLPAHLLDWVKAAGLLAFTDASVATFSSGGFGRLDDNVFTGRMLVLDRDGLAEVTHALRGAVGHAEQAQALSRARLAAGNAAALNVVLGAAAFRTAGAGMRCVSIDGGE